MADLISLDMLGLILQVAQLALIGLVIGLLVFFYQDIPIIPRKYWSVKIKREVMIGGQSQLRVVKETKGWMVKKKKGIPFFRVLLKGFPKWKGVDLDWSYTKSMDESGVLCLIEERPEITEAANFRPEFIPITQYENHLNELREKMGFTEQAIMVYKDIMSKHSRLIDMDESGSMQDFVVTKNAQANRVAGDNMLEKLFPYVALIFIGLFMYLAYDSLAKSFTNASGQFATISGYYTQQTVEACGGQFKPMDDGKNETAKPNGGIPFLNG